MELLREFEEAEQIDDPEVLVSILVLMELLRESSDLSSGTLQNLSGFQSLF